MVGLLWLAHSISTELTYHTKAGDMKSLNSIAKHNIKRKLKMNKHLIREKPPKNIILFIGDGMGIATVTSYRIAKNQKHGNFHIQHPVFFETFPITGLVKTYSHNSHVTDSAAGAVAMYSGYKVDRFTVGMLPGLNKPCTDVPDEHIQDGIADEAVKDGLNVGFVTNTRITHATPAALYAKGVHRSLEYEIPDMLKAHCKRDIASQILHPPASKFKVMMGGGRAYFMNATRNGMRTDGRNIDFAWERLGGRRKVLRSVDDLKQYDVSKGGMVLGLFSESTMEWAIRKNETEPTLKMMTEKAIEIMQRDRKGYFLMVEGGLIDVGQHKNSMHKTFAEMEAFEDAIQQAREMTDPSETLILVTADHAHALTIPGYAFSNESIFGSYSVRNYSVPSMFFALGPGYRGGFRTEQLNGDPTQESYLQPSAIYTKSGHHGGENVGIWADGPFAELFTGTLENTEIAYLIKYLLCIGVFGNNLCDEDAQQSKFYNLFINYTAQTDPAILTIAIAVLAGSLFLVTAILIVETVKHRRKPIKGGGTDTGRSWSESLQEEISVDSVI